MHVEMQTTTRLYVIVQNFLTVMRESLSSVASSLLQ